MAGITDLMKRSQEPTSPTAYPSAFMAGITDLNYSKALIRYFNFF